MFDHYCVSLFALVDSICHQPSFASVCVCVCVCECKICGVSFIFCAVEHTVSSGTNYKHILVHVQYTFHVESSFHLYFMSKIVCNCTDR